MKISRDSSFALVLLFVALFTVSNVSAFVAPSRGRTVTFVSSSSASTSKSRSSVAQPEIAHLQKKLKYWKGQEVAKQDELKDYVSAANIASKAKPIYVRDGKIDMYTPRPVFDQETMRIQTEVWTIKEKIKLTQAKMEEEERIQRVTKEMAHKLSQQDAEKARIRKEAEKKVLALKAQSTERLTEKEQEIDTLAKDIENLSKTLQEKRNQLETKESDLMSLSSSLQDKESVLYKLNRERASLRCLVRQSWKVLKSRVKKRLPHRENKNNDGALSETIEVNGNANVQVSEVERVLVEAR